VAKAMRAIPDARILAKPVRSALISQGAKLEGKQTKS